MQQAQNISWSLSVCWHYVGNGRQKSVENELLIALVWLLCTSVILKIKCTVLMTIPSLDIRLQDRKSFVLCVQTKWNISKLLGLGFHQILIQELSAPVWLCACILISFCMHNAPRKDKEKTHMYWRNVLFFILCFFSTITI